MIHEQPNEEDKRPEGPKSGTIIQEKTPKSDKPADDDKKFEVYSQQHSLGGSEGPSRKDTQRPSIKVNNEPVELQKDIRRTPSSKADGSLVKSKNELPDPQRDGRKTPTMNKLDGSVMKSQNDVADPQRDSRKVPTINKLDGSVREDDSRQMSDRKPIIDYGPTSRQQVPQSRQNLEFIKGAEKLARIALRDYYDENLNFAIVKGLEEVGRVK